MKGMIDFDGCNIDTFITIWYNYTNSYKKVVTWLNKEIGKVSLRRLSN